MQVFSCSGIYASRLSGAALSDLRPPVIKDFKLSHRQGMLVRTASEDMTLYVSSGSVISVGSNIYDGESGIASCRLSLRSAGKSSEIEQLIYDGQVEADVEVDLSKYDLLHGVSHTVVLEAINRAGMSTRVQASVLLDSSPPVSGLVLDGMSEIKVICQGPSLVISVDWTAFIDAETTILFHQVAAATTPREDFQQDLAHFGLPLEPLQATIELDPKMLLRSDDTIYVSVKAMNAAGMSSVAVSGPLTVKCTTDLCECTENIVCV